MPDPMSIYFSEAKTHEELEAVYRLRYRVFKEELGEERYADHQRKIWIDEDDCDKSIVLAGWNQEHRPVATMRLTFLRDHAFIGLESYELDLLSEHLCMSPDILRGSLAKADRAVIEKPYRATGLLPRLQRAIDQEALERGCCVLVGSVQIDNERSLVAFQALGWHVYCNSSSYRGLQCRLVYKKIG